MSLANLGGDFSVLGNEPVVSVGLGRTYGLETLYQQKFTKHFYGILAFTLYKSEFTGLDASDYMASAWDSGVLLTFTGGYKFGNNWEIGARVRHLGKTPFPPVDEAATLVNYPAVVLDYDRLGEVRLDPFNQTDIRFDKKWNLKGFTLNMFLEFQNIFGEETPQAPSYGLKRDDEGNIIEPRMLKEITDISRGSVLPTLGIIIDF